MCPLADAVRTTKDGRPKFVEKLDRRDPQFAWVWEDETEQTVRYRGKIWERGDRDG